MKQRDVTEREKVNKVEVVHHERSSELIFEKFSKFTRVDMVHHERSSKLIFEKFSKFTLSKVSSLLLSLTFRFSKVSSLLNSLQNATVELNF